jgi:hypothetical protein
MKTTTQIYEQRQRVFRLAMSVARDSAHRVHPETGGQELLVHNWGNAESKAAWARGWDRWHRIAGAFDSAYDAAEHRNHVTRGFKPHWCEDCKSSRKGRAS